MMGYNSTSMAALFAMQQNDMLQAQTIFAQVSADASAQAAQRWQTMQTSQTNLFAVAQDVTAGAALRATASWSLMDAYLR